MHHSLGVNSIISSRFPMSMVQLRYVVSKRDRRKRRKPMTPITSKLKKIKMKPFSCQPGLTNQGLGP
ncbi:hypothetical protein CsatB_010645 [Cannabis sativa]